MPCDRVITRLILEMLIKSKVKHLFQIKDTKRARLYRTFSQWWLRGSNEKENIVQINNDTSLSDMKRELCWSENDTQNDDKPWIDQFDMSILAYTILANNTQAVRECLALYEHDCECMLAWKFSRDGVVDLGIPGHQTCLFIAMGLANSEIVVALLESGANIYATDIMGNDAVMIACTFGRIKNIETWFSKNANWEVDRRNDKFGSTALHFAVYIGGGKLSTVQYLIEKQNANMNISNKSGTSSLILACGNEDCDPIVVRYLLKQGINIHRQIKSQTMNWKILRAVARLVVKSKVPSSKLLRRIAESGGLTALHYAARRGDIEIVELLMEHGADASIKNDLGRDVLSYCNVFPEIKSAIERVKREDDRVQGNTTRNSTREVRAAKPTARSSNFTLQRRLSTATPVKYDMYLMSLSTMISLYVIIDRMCVHMLGLFFCFSYDSSTLTTVTKLHSFCKQIRRQRRSKEEQESMSSRSFGEWITYEV